MTFKTFPKLGRGKRIPGDLRDQLTLNCELLLRLGRLHFTKLALAVAEQGGPMVPGPAGSQAVWVTSGPPTETALSLVTLTGHRSGQSIHFPPGGPQVPSTAVTDGRGDVLVTDGHFSVYDAGPGWDRPVPGTVVAVGPATWLNDVCDEQYRHCRNEIIDPANGSHWAVPGPAATGAQYTFSWPPTGVISPDGSTAA